LEHLTYQDADKSIADIGWWEEVDRSERRMIFTLHGTGAPQRYALIRTSKDWLLHRTKDQPVEDQPPVEDRPPVEDQPPVEDRPLVEGLASPEDQPPA
jgi:hypothetical protein